MKLMRALTLLALLTAVAGIHADDTPDRKGPSGLLKATPEQLLKLWDKNKNGYVEKDEVPQAVQKVFDQLDKNGDGKLDQTELGRLLDLLKKRRRDQDANQAKARAKSPASATDTDREVNALLRRLDANQDGKISKEEAAGRPLAKRFDALDRNKDGYLDRSELTTWVQRAAKAGKGQANADIAARNNSFDFDSLDRDADGRLTLEELRGTRWAELFEKIDANKDGQIERKEFEIYLRRIAAESAKVDSEKGDKLKKN
jgi:Ca2+-binding EF-hand superfamily protein